MVVFLDAGHGGLSPEGKYVTSPSKMFTHELGIFHEGNKFYEGVKNRNYCSEMIRIFNKMGINCVPVYHKYLDTPLKVRVNAANYYHRNIEKGVYISEHSNASSNGMARGFQAYTSRGDTKSDSLADIIHKDITNNLMVYPEVKVMSDLSDGDYDYEASFYVLTKTIMPAVLLENLFFDNKYDAELLMKSYYMISYCESICESVRKFIND